MEKEKKVVWLVGGLPGGGGGGGGGGLLLQNFECSNSQ